MTWAFVSFFTWLFTNLWWLGTVDRTEGSTPRLCGDPVNTDPAGSRGVGPKDRLSAPARAARVEETSGSDDADFAL